MCCGVPDHADDDAVEDPCRARDHVDVAVRDRVVRAGRDRGDHGERLEERDARLAVLAARAHGQRQLGLGARVGLDDEEAVGCEQRRQVAREAWLDLGEHAVGRVDQHEIVLRSGGRFPRDRSENVAVDDARARQPQPVEVPLDRPHGVRVVLDEDGARGAA